MMNFLQELAASIDLADLLWAAGLFLVTFTVSLVVVGWLLVALPATYFLDRHVREFWVDRHPVVRWSGIIGKNLLGVALVAAGLMLSLPGVPGQGVLTILIGVVLLDFPGKRRLERKLVGVPRLLRTINRLRSRFNRPPLVLDDAELEEEDRRPPTA